MKLRDLLKKVLAVSVLLITVTAISSASASEKTEITITANTAEKKLSCSGNVKCDTEAQIGANGLELKAFTESKDKFGETIKVPQAEKSYLAVNVEDSLYLKSILNKYVEVTYFDNNHDSSAWLSIEYINVNGVKAYTEKAGVKNSGKASNTYTFCLNDALFDNSLDGYDFRLVTYINNSEYMYATAPYYIQSVRVYTDNTVSPVKLTADSENKGNIFYTDDIAALNVCYENKTSDEVSFEALYEIFGLSGNGEEKLIDRQTVAYTVAGDDSVKENIELDANEYGLYKMVIMLSGSYKDDIINSKLDIDFSRCILNDKPNPHFGTLASESSGDLMINAGMGAVRRGYLLPFGQGTKYKVPEPWLPFLKNAQLYNIDCIGSIMFQEDYSLPDPETQYDNMYNTALNFVKGMDGRIKKISIGNEPECMKYAGNHQVSGTIDDYKLLGERYGYMASAVAEAVKDSGANVKLGAFETMLSDAETSESGYSRGKLNAFYTAALDIMKKKNVLSYFDAYVCHAYMGYKDTERVYDDNISYVRNILDQYGYGKNGKYEIWSNEGGWSSADVKYYSIVIPDNEYEKANRIVKQYITMMGNDPNGTYLFYDLIDNADINSAAEANFGMIRAASRTGGVPYAAKQTYLAVSAVNKLTSGMTDTEKVNVAEDNCFGYKFRDDSGNSVYAYWWDDKETNEPPLCSPTSDDKSQHTVTVAEDLSAARLYDIFGNELDKSSYVENNRLIVTNEVIYVYFGDEIPRATKVVKSNIINISGVIASGAPDKNVSLVVVDEGTDISKLPAGIRYVNQTITGENGEYLFTALVNEQTNGIEAYIYTEEDDIPRKLSFFGEDTKYDIALRSGIFRIGELNLNMLDTSKLKLRLRFGDKVKDTTEFKAYAVLYKDNKLNGMIAGSGKYEDGGDKLWIFDAPENSGEYDTVKIMLWNTDMIPLIDAQIIAKTEY